MHDGFFFFWVECMHDVVRVLSITLLLLLLRIVTMEGHVCLHREYIGIENIKIRVQMSSEFLRGERWRIMRRGAKDIR